MQQAKPELRRVLGPLAITVYAIGDILGAGIYALVGKVAALAGAGAWISFVISAVIAVLTGLTYAELSSRYPVAAGAAAYCRRAYRAPVVAFLVGCFVLASGVTSAATIAHAFIGYMNVFVALPHLLASIGLLFLMSALNFVGIRESARVNFAMTMTELTGLLVVIIVGVRYAFGVPLTDLGSNLAPTAGTNALLAGATVAFFAYIGFEDTANIAEEVRDPSRVLPRAILTAITVTCLVYVAVTLAALAVVRSDSLATSDAPLLLVLETAGLKLPAEAFAIIALIAICNTGLLNLIMVSRLMYGMAREGLLPAFLTYVHPARRTPSTAVAAGFLLAALLAASGGVQVLAQTTSLLLLCVFAVLHVGLVRIRLRDGDAPNGVFRTPLWTPIAGALICGGMTLQYPMGAYVRALIVTLVAAVLYFGVGRRALLAHNEAGKSLP